ncbi:MAG: DJ-1/PfpI family protein, partial [Clostridia bacterium]|nr:DJ-1/PfpI family protein [Clostridia bacterium]
MIYLFLAQGFEEIEALTPVDILRRAGIEIRTVSIYDTLEVEGRSKIRVVADCSIGEIDVEKMEMAILPGGMPGTANLESNEKIQQIIGQALKQDKWVAAICAAPTILGKQGYLSGREAVCYPGCEEDLKG